ncbi:MAG: tetratricopeptide repeat protein [Thermodesulfovibrionales bacterium]|nr:tetratricopeptide repeat protein [Thermodesulfovibrionales bacterium]
MSLNEITRHLDIANNLFLESKYDEALRHYRKALIVDRSNPVPYYNIANILARQGKYIPAEQHYKNAINYGLSTQEVFCNLANVLKELGRLSEARYYYELALSLNPQMFESLNGLGNVSLAQGFLGEAMKFYHDALMVNPLNPEVFSNLLLSMNYSHAVSDTEIFEAHKRYGEIFEKKEKRSIKPKGRIRLGYVSQDFRRHSVSYFLLPILHCHDRSCFEIYCYSDVFKGDTYTEVFKRLSDVWIDVHHMTHEELYRKILLDDVDILIDLAGHTEYNRLPVFAMRPSPIQITYLGYPNTTGLLSMDYRIVDDFTDPDVLTDGFNTERLIRLKDCFLCFCPDGNLPPCLDPPFLKNGYLTFGSLNNISKVNDFTIDLWADVLLNIEGARLLIKSKALNDDSVKTRILTRFMQRGIDEKRLILLGYVKGFYNHLEVYNMIDISLDTFPYNGTTTTFESLIMGTPVVTLVGNTHRSRVGYSVLKNLGCDELIANNHDDFVSICKTLSLDPSRIVGYKKGLRERLLSSILTDGKTFTQRFEGVLLNLYNHHK